MAYDNSLPEQNVFSHPVNFQLPAFVCSATPTLAPGGGAEVLPVSLLSDNVLAQNWFSNSGFAPQFSSQDSKDDNSHQASASEYAPPLRQQQQSGAAPFDFDSYTVPSAQTLQEPQTIRVLAAAELSAFIQPYQNPSALPNPLLPSADLPAPSSLGLPVYSASGFDLLSILARVANRPHPRVILGPVDLTCSFVVVDVRRFDHPIVYCSPSFCRLTGYSEQEVIGRNCRFLQAPNGQVQRGESRRFTDHSAVVHLKKNLSADKECQTSIVNFKKDGTAFINLVTVIPILGGVSGAPHEESEVVYHVGFQVDLTEQPNAILEKLRDGSYIVDYGLQQRGQLSQPSSCLGPHHIGHLKDRKSHAIPSVRISRDLKLLLNDPAFVKSISISTSTTIPPSQSPARAETDSTTSVTGNNQLLHLLLLEASPDFIHVVSLKGSFLYVAPSVRRVLGYEPEEMVGASISDYAHPEDVVPLMRELKEGSATGLAALANATAVNGPGGCGGNGSGGSGVDGGVTAVTDQSQIQAAAGMQMAPRTVDLLFRARTKAGVYVWIECKGRLHVEPGKGRKAIVLSGRAKEMPKLDWHRVALGGLSMPVPTILPTGTGVGLGRTMTESEVWGTMSNGYYGSGGVVSFLVIGHAVSDILGWTPSELVGREVINFIVEGGNRFMEEVHILGNGEGHGNPRLVCCRMRHKNGLTLPVIFVLYRPTHDSSVTESIKGIIRAPFIYQLRSYESTTSSSNNLVHSLDADVFGELDTSRDSSWQYELQQLRFANQRLEDEISALSKQLEGAEDVQQKVLDELQQQNSHKQYTQSDSSPPPHFDYPPPPGPSHQKHHHHQYIQHRDLPPTSSIQQNPQPYSTSNHGTFPPHCSVSPLSFTRDWDSFLDNTRSQGLKRSWDTDR